MLIGERIQRKNIQNSSPQRSVSPSRRYQQLPPTGSFSKRNCDRHRISIEDNGKLLNSASSSYTLGRTGSIQCHFNMQAQSHTTTSMLKKDRVPETECWHHFTNSSNSISASIRKMTFGFFPKCLFPELIIWYILMGARFLFNSFEMIVSD